MAALRRALDTDDPAGALSDLRAALGAPGSLAELGMPRDGLARIAQQAVTAPYPNPRPLEQAPLLALLEAAYEGRRPTGNRA